MIRAFDWGMAQKCRRCEAKGYTGDDCWWPANNADYWHRLNVGARVAQFNGECKACVAERAIARAARQAEQGQVTA